MSSDKGHLTLNKIPRMSASEIVWNMGSSGQLPYRIGKTPAIVLKGSCGLLEKTPQGCLLVAYKEHLSRIF